MNLDLSTDRELLNLYDKASNAAVRHSATHRQEIAAIIRKMRAKSPEWARRTLQHCYWIGIDAGAKYRNL